MGSYRRKIYKKRSMDLFHEKGLDGLIKDELDFFYMNEGASEQIMLFKEYPPILNEPDIVRELKEEERLGKLQTFIVDIPGNYKQHYTTTMTESLNVFEESKSGLKKRKINSYKDALTLAKKVLNRVSNL